jgi:hypothetical protein
LGREPGSLVRDWAAHLLGTNHPSDQGGGGGGGRRQALRQASSSGHVC